MHRVVDDDATGSCAHLQARPFGERGVRTNTHSHHYDIRWDLLARFKTNRSDATGFARDQCLGVRLNLESDTFDFERGLQQFARLFIKLSLHKPRHDMHHGHIHPAQLEPIRRFKPEQTAADHDRMFVALRGINHRFGVGDVTIRNHTGKFRAVNRQHERIRSGSDKQTIIVMHFAFRSFHLAFGAMNFRHHFSSDEFDAVFFVPIPIIEHNVLHRLLAREHGREKYSVVVRMRLCTKHGNVVFIRCDF